MAGRVLKAPAVRLAPTGSEVRAAARQRSELDAAYEEGRRDAMVEGAGQLPAVLAAIQAAAGEVADAARAQQAEDVLSVIEVAVEVARWVLQRELETVPEALTDRVRAALVDLPDGGPVVVRVHPGAASLLESVTGVTVLGDAGLSPGDARIDVGDTRVELDQEAALRLAIAALQGAPA